MTGDPTPPAPALTAPAPPVPTDVGVVPEDDADPTGLPYGKAQRTLFAALAAVLMGLGVVVWGGSWLLAAAATAFTAVVGFAVVSGKEPDPNPTFAPASRRFRELADPRRPLTPEDVGPPPGRGDRPLPAEPRRDG